MAHDPADSSREPGDEAFVARVSADIARYRRRERLLMVSVSVIAVWAVVAASPLLIALGAYVSELPGTLTALVTRIAVPGVG
jgi:hypothetical protein